MGEQVSHFDISEFLHFNQPTGTASQDQDFQVGKWFSVLWSRSRSEPSFFGWNRSRIFCRLRAFLKSDKPKKIVKLILNLFSYKIHRQRYRLPIYMYF